MASIIKVDQIQESTTGVGTNFPNIVYLDDDTTANTPVLSFTGDTNTGIGRSAANSLDFITDGASRLRIEPTGQIKAVYESQVGTPYNTTLHNGYLCRAWAKINQFGTSIYASGNISTITDVASGITTFNFTTSLPDTNYAAIGISQGNSIENWSHIIDNYFVDKVTIIVGYTAEDTTTFLKTDRDHVTLAVFR